MCVSHINPQAQICENVAQHTYLCKSHMQCVKHIAYKDVVLYRVTFGKFWKRKAVFRKHYVKHKLNMHLAALSLLFGHIRFLSFIRALSISFESPGSANDIFKQNMW